jgi:hypothetical protein
LRSIFLRAGDAQMVSVSITWRDHLAWSHCAQHLEASAHHGAARPLKVDETADRVDTSAPGTVTKEP